MTINLPNSNAALSYIGGLIKKSFRFTEKVVIASWLLLLYFVSIWLVLGTITAFHLQTQVSKIALEEDIYRAIRIQKQDDGLKWQLDDIRRNIATTGWELTYLDLSKSKLTTAKLPTEELSVRMVRNQDKIDKLKETKRDYEQQLNYVQSRIKTLHETYANYFSSEDEKWRKIRELSADYQYMGRWAFSPIVEMPGFLLTLILSISMGALGSVIHLTWEFFDKATARRYSYYFFRPFLGGVLAFSIFILLKSGSMLLAGAPTSDAISGELNPFFISFLSIISGMLSQQAYERISAAGTRILAIPQEEQPRWVRASVLIAAMEQQQKTPNQLVPYVHETEEKIQEWFSEKEHVTEKNQSIISAWLGLSVRDLFTDQEAEKVQEREKPEPTPDQPQPKDVQEKPEPTPDQPQPKDVQEKPEPAPDQPQPKDVQKKPEPTPEEDGTEETPKGTKSAPEQEKRR